MKNFVVGEDLFGEFVIVNGKHEFTWTPELAARYGDPNCTCSMIVIDDMDMVIAGGADDCPVHGFGEEDESEPEPECFRNWYEEGWQCENDVTSCCWNDGNNTCSHPSKSCWPLSEDALTSQENEV